MWAKPKPLQRIDKSSVLYSVGIHYVHNFHGFWFYGRKTIHLFFILWKNNDIAQYCVLPLDGGYNFLFQHEYVVKKSLVDFFSNHFLFYNAHLISVSIFIHLSIRLQCSSNTIFDPPKSLTVLYRFFSLFVSFFWLTIHALSPFFYTVWLN